MQWINTFWGSTTPDSKGGNILNVVHGTVGKLGRGANKHYSVRAEHPDCSEGILLVLNSVNIRLFRWRQLLCDWAATWSSFASCPPWPAWSPRRPARAWILSSRWCTCSALDPLVCLIIPMWERRSWTLSDPHHQFLFSSWNLKSWRQTFYLILIPSSSAALSKAAWAVTGTNISPIWNEESTNNDDNRNKLFSEIQQMIPWLLYDTREIKKQEEPQFRPLCLCPCKPCKPELSTRSHQW